MLSSIPMSLGSAGQEVFTRKHMNDSIKMEGKTVPLVTLGFSLPVHQPTKEGITILTGVMDLVYQGKIGLLLHTGGEGWGKASQECICWAVSVESQQPTVARLLTFRTF